MDSFYNLSKLINSAFSVLLVKIQIMIRAKQSLITLSCLFVLTLVGLNNVYSQITWDPAIEVAPSSFGNNRPRIVTDKSGYPLLLWGKSTDAMFSRWDGSSFTIPVKLNPNGVTIASADWMGPEIAARGDTVYVVYKQTPENLESSHIWIRRSFDGGVTFNDPVQVENTGTDKSRFPAVTIDDQGHPIVAFMRFNTSFNDARWVVTRSFDFGETFAPDVLASGWSGPASDVCDCCPGSIQCSGNIVAVIYRDNNENLRDSWAGISNDGGLTFTKGVNVDQNGWMIQACPATGPDGVIIGDTLFTTFMNGASGKALVYYNETSISDLSTPPSIAVPGSGEGLQQNFSRIASSGLATALVWRNAANFSTGLALMFSEDITKGFPGSIDTLAFSQVDNGDVAVTDTKVFVAWQDNATSKVKFRSGTYQTSTNLEENIKTTQLFLFPNPVSTLLQLHQSSTTIRITDMSGRLVITGKGNNIEVSSLTPGIYFIFSETGWGKFVKQ